MWSGEQVERVRQLAAEKKTAGEMAKVLAVTRNAIIGLCHRNKIPLISGKFRPPMEARTPKPKPEKKIGSTVIRRLSSRRPLRGNHTWIPTEVTPMKVSLLDLQPNQCRSVVDGETDDNFLPIYCGNPTYADKPYCLAHCCEYYNGFRAVAVREAA